MRKALGYCLELAGVAGLSYAGWLVSEALGIVIAAAFVLAIGLILGRET